MTALNLGRQDSDSPQQRLLRGVHETFASTLAASLSAFLQSEIGASLDAIAFVSAADFQRALSTPACIVNLQLDPRPEHAILSLDCSTVFILLELLLGGRPAAGSPETRALTEIEWALLEEVVRVLVTSLGESWKAYHAVEFKVLSLESDPALLAVPDPTLQLVQLAFTLQVSEQIGSFQIGVPRAFFETTLNPAESLAFEPAVEDLQRNLALLAEANVELELVLDGPTMEFKELSSLSVGQVMRLDYPLQKPLRAMVNGATSIPCQIVSVGRKRAFQVQQP